MKSKTILLLLTLTSVACQKQSENHANTTAHEHQDQVSGVQLNNGAKWEANVETTEGIDRMIERIESFKQEASSDYPALQANLLADFKMIFEKCTMKGEAHNQLHNYLLPLKKELEQLSNTNLDSVNDYLHNYKNYFQ